MGASELLYKRKIIYWRDDKHIAKSKEPGYADVVKKSQWQQEEFL